MTTAQSRPATSSVPTVSIVRTIAAPRALVFRAFVTPEHIMRWWGGEGIVTSECTIDLRVGGSFSYRMRSSVGREYRCICIYREIDEPRRLVFTNRFVDAQGSAAPHPDLPSWPRETLVAIAFSDDGRKTRVTLEQSVIDGTDTENEAFLFARDGSATFWNGTLDRLAAELA